MKRLLATAALALSYHVVHAAEAIHAFEPDSFRQIVASKAGKPFVVMVWSLDCAYCAQSFETLAEANRKRGLDVVTIATDSVDDRESFRLITRKLEAYRLTGNAWAFGASPPEQLRYAIDPKWRGELPRSYWFGANGKVTAHSGVISKERIAALVGNW